MFYSFEKILGTWNHQTHYEYLEKSYRIIELVQLLYLSNLKVKY